MLQTPTVQEPNRTPINIDEPVNPYKLCNDTYMLTGDIIKYLEVGTDHFKNDQQLSKINPNDIDGVCTYLSDMFTWLDGVYLKITHAARNQYMLVEYLNASKKALEEAKEYGSSEQVVKKRKLEPYSDMDTVE